jgi:hypothetical protein
VPLSRNGVFKRERIWSEFRTNFAIHTNTYYRTVMVVECRKLRWLGIYLGW